MLVNGKSLPFSVPLGVHIKIGLSSIPRCCSDLVKCIGGCCCGCCIGGCCCRTGRKTKSWIRKHECADVFEEAFKDDKESFTFRVPCMFRVLVSNYVRQHRQRVYGIVQVYLSTLPDTVETLGSATCAVGQAGVRAARACVSSLKPHALLA